MSNDKGNKKKSKQLGMPHGTANNKLKKAMLFSMICELELNDCYRCGDTIETVDDLSIDHKEPWLDSKNPVGLFFDLENIAFSHLSCNCSASRGTQKYFTEEERKEAARKRTNERYKKYGRAYDPKKRRATYLRTGK